MAFVLPEEIIRRVKNVYSFMGDENYVDKLLEFIRIVYPYGYKNLDREIRRRYIEDITWHINEQLGEVVRHYFNGLDENTLKSCIVVLESPGITTDHDEIWLVENREETDDEWVSRIVEELGRYEKVYEDYKNRNKYEED